MIILLLECPMKFVSGYILVLLHPKYAKYKKHYKIYTYFVVELAKNIDSHTRSADPYHYTMISNQ